MQLLIVIIKPAQLTNYKKLILSKGLSFVPSKTLTNEQLINDLDKFEEQLIQRTLPYTDTTYQIIR